MHIPDNYLSPGTCAVLGTAMAGMWALSARRVSLDLDASRIPGLGVAAAFSFLVMMFNIPLPGGTSGHAVGAVLAAVLVGPWAACIAVSTALVIQALLFGDGGILALGANCFNMAVVMPFSGWFLFRMLRRVLKGRGGELASLGIAAWFGINLAALFTAVEFGLQPLIAQDAAGLPLYCPYPLGVSIPAMLIPHMAVAGFVEAAFTVAVFAFVRRVSPGDILTPETTQGNAPVPAGHASLAMFLGGLCVLSPLGLLAAGTAWGEWSTEELPGLASGAIGAIPQGMSQGFSFASPFADYAMEGLPEWAGYILSAIAGLALVVLVFRIAGMAVHKLRKSSRHES